MSYLLFKSTRQKLAATLSRWVLNTTLPSLFHRFLAKNIIHYYDGDYGHQTNRRTGNLGFGFIHYSLIINSKPKRILCVGSRKGFIPAICALACAENGMGHVDFVDAGYDIEDANHWSGIGWWRHVNPDTHFAFLQINKWLTTYVMTTNEFAKKAKYKYDYIYIDGDHSYEGAKNDWNLFWPRLNRGGFMVFHDVAVHHTKALGTFGVWRLWEEKAKHHAITFPYPKDSGLGILQKQ